MIQHRQHDQSRHKQCHKGLVIVVALVFMAQFTPVTGDQWWQESVLIPHLETIADWARKALPEAASGVAGY